MAASNAEADDRLDETKPVTPRRRSRRTRRRRWLRALVVLIGLLIPQAILTGRALVGQTILLPLDILKLPGVYLPPRHLGVESRHQDMTYSDLVLQLEPNRQFAVREIRAGRLPLWNPYSYCGAPFLAANQPAVFSPYRLIDYLWPGPAAIAWGHLLRMLVAGGGAYLFFRRTLRVRFLAAAIGAWCFPLAGFLTMWSGFLQEWVVTWLPLLLWATHQTIHRPRSMMPVALALVTAALLLSGHAATAVQVLLLDGCYAIFAIVRRYGWLAIARCRGVVGVTLLGAWIAGVLLSLPQTLPTLEYVRHSYRIAARSEGFVETPPAGMSALPTLVLPWFHGSRAAGMVYLPQTGNRIEGLAAGYAGLVMTLVAAPLAWLSRRHRAALIFWLLAAVLGAGQVLDIPLISAIYRTPGLNTLRNNRLVCITGFAVLTWGVVGLHAMLRARRGVRDDRARVGDAPKRVMLPGAQDRAARRRVIAAVALSIAPVALGVVCILRYAQPPAILRERLDHIAQTLPTRDPSPQMLEQARREAADSFATMHLAAAIWCGAAVAVLAALTILMTARPPARVRAGVVAACGLLMIVELLARAWHTNPQSDPRLYYPRSRLIDALAARAARAPGRMCAVEFLPAALSMSFGLPDVRGYDAADPIWITELLLALRDPGAATLPYAKVQWFYPREECGALDLLNLRYLIGTGDPPAMAPPGMMIPWAGDGAFVMERAGADARVFVPRRVQVMPHARDRLAELARPRWNVRDALLLEERPPTEYGDVSGEARVVRDEPTRVDVEATMRTPGFVLLCDAWDAGWRASVNGAPARVWRADHAFRAVELPAGTSHVAFRYEPASFRNGCYASLVGAVLLVVFGSLNVSPRRRATPRAHR